MLFDQRQSVVKSSCPSHVKTTVLCTTRDEETAVLACEWKRVGREICTHIIRSDRVTLEYSLRKHWRICFREQSRIGRGRTQAWGFLQPICNAPTNGLLFSTRLQPAETKALSTHASSWSKGGRWDQEGVACWKQSLKLRLQYYLWDPVTACSSPNPQNKVQGLSTWLRSQVHRENAAG